CSEAVLPYIEPMSACSQTMSADSGSMSAYSAPLSTDIGPMSACSQALSTDVAAMPAYSGGMSTHSEIEKGRRLTSEAFPDLRSRYDRCRFHGAGTMPSSQIRRIRNQRSMGEAPHGSR